MRPDPSELQFGQFTLVWRPPNGAPAAVGAGMRSPTVRWLRQSLAALDDRYRPQEADADFFDAGLEEALIDFQRRNRLEADGLAGQKTQILINTLLARDDTPRLTPAR